jgi:hypothetical protein
MGERFTTIAGAMPHPRLFAWLAWRDALKAHRLRYLNESSRARTTTFYVDSVAGNDANDGSIGSPWATLEKIHDTIAAGSGDQRFRIKRGSVFAGDKGGEHQWTASDTGHNCAVYIDQPGITIDLYGTGDDPLFHVSAPLTSISWTQDATAYYCDVTGLGAIDQVYETDETTTPFTFQSSLANCKANARSFFYDSGTSRLYVNYNGSSTPPTTLHIVQRNNYSCFRIGNVDDICIDVVAGKGYGWGFDRADTNSHDYFISIGVRDDNECFVRGQAYYSSAHCIASWDLSTVTDAGGIVTYYQCKGGRTINNSGGERVINFYWPGGGMESLAVAPEALYPALTGTLPVQAVNGHSGGTNNTLALVVDCVGGVGQSNIAFDATDMQACRFLACGGGVGDNANRRTEMPSNGVFINFSSYGARSTTGGISTATWVGHLLNCTLSKSTANGSDPGFIGIGWNDPTTPANATTKFLHCLISEERNGAFGPKRGQGLCYDPIVTADVQSGMKATRCLFRGVNSTATYPCVPGIGNDDAHQSECGYFGMQSSTSRNQAGYNGATSAIALTADPAAFVSDLLVVTPTAEMVVDVDADSPEYDALEQRRGLTQTAIGPIELPSLVIPDAPIGGITAAITSAITFPITEAI